MSESTVNGVSFPHVARCTASILVRELESAQMFEIALQRMMARVCAASGKITDDMK